MISSTNFTVKSNTHLHWNIINLMPNPLLRFTTLSLIKKFEATIEAIIIFIFGRCLHISKDYIKARNLFIKVKIKNVTYLFYSSTNDPQPPF